MIDIAFPASRIRHYMRVTGRSSNWIIKQSYIALISKISTTEDCYYLDFYKSRSDEVMLKWCEEAWGPPGVSETWWHVKSDQSHLIIVVRGEDQVAMWQLAWE